MTVCEMRCHDWNLKTSFPAFSQREDSPRQLFPPLSSLRTQSMETSLFQAKAELVGGHEKGKLFCTMYLTTHSMAKSI